MEVCCATPPADRSLCSRQQKVQQHSSGGGGAPRRARSTGVSTLQRLRPLRQLCRIDADVTIQFAWCCKAMSVPVRREQLQKKCPTLQAQRQHAIGKISSFDTHLDANERPTWRRDLVRGCLTRALCAELMGWLPLPRQQPCRRLRGRHELRAAAAGAGEASLRLYYCQQHLGCVHYGRGCRLCCLAATAAMNWECDRKGERATNLSLSAQQVGSACAHKCVQADTRSRALFLHLDEPRECVLRCLTRGCLIWVPLQTARRPNNAKWPRTASSPRARARTHCADRRG